MTAAVTPAGAGAPIGDIALVAGIVSLATIAVLALVVAYRTGRARPLRRLEVLAERFLGVPGWAAVPAVAAIGCAVITFLGAIWDIGVHIDKGRDNGPFGTPAHFPMLAGLLGLYLMGLLAVGMAPQARERASRAAVRIPTLGLVPVGGLLILAGGGYALLAFPLDDLWHRIFGQDVTLWGPTHTMFFGGVITGACGAVVLLAEGARTLGREPFRGRTWVPWRPLPAILGGIFLFVGTHATDEFNWGLPQYRQVWQPLLLALFGALGLVLARGLGGRGAAAGALAVYLPLQFLEVFLIGALGTTRPASVLFVAEALLVELVWWRAPRGRELRRGALAGLAVGTVGFAAEYGWSQLAMPLPWHSGLIAEGLPSAALAGVAGGVLAALLTLALRGRLAQVRRPGALALGAAAVVVALGVNASISTQPAAHTTLALTGIHMARAPGGGQTRVADVTVRFSRPDLVRGANWAYVLGWQGGGRFHTDLVRQADGSYRAAAPVPIGGHWKTFVRVQKGRVMFASAIRMPSDPALKFAGLPARSRVTRPLIADTKLLQIERKDDGPLWAWTPALLLVMGLNLALMGLIGWGCARSGRVAAGTSIPPRQDSVRPPRRGARATSERRVPALGARQRA